MKGACTVGLEIQLHSTLICLEKKNFKMPPNNTEMRTHIEYLNTAACYISPEGKVGCPVPFPAGTPIKDTIVFSFLFWLS